MAKEYHDTDFDIAELSDEEQAYVSRTAVLSLGSRPVESTSSTSSWDAFYLTHKAKFFHPRYFTLKLFPELERAGLLLETGCGNGSNILPLLEKTHGTIYGSDCSEASLDALRTLPAAEQYADRLHLFRWDLTEAPPDSLPLVDAAVCMFVLSALAPDTHLKALINIRESMKPGALLAFRDYGWLDLAQLRAPDSSILTPSLHLRPDGTRAYYFTLTELTALLMSAGFEVEECRHACVQNMNRKRGLAMRRVFVHAKARRR